MNTNANIDHPEVHENTLLAKRLQHSPNGWFTLRTLRLAMRHPYMFPNPNLGLEMCIAWNPTFGQLCTDIDALLGKDKRGFCWRQLTHVKGAPAWYWRLDAGGPHARHVRGARRAESAVMRSLESLEREHIVAVLQAVGANRHQAAQVLGISERTLYRKLGDYGLESGE